MRRTIVAAGILTSVALAGPAIVPAAAQSRVVVPIVIQAPRPGALSPSRTQTTHVTTRTASPQLGVTTTRVTVSDTTGAGRTVGMSTAATTLGTVSTGTPSVLVTVDRRLAPDGSGASGRTTIIVEDVSQSNRTVGGPAPVSAVRTASPGQQTLIITSEAPIDAPIVILAP
jgi:hypothetical protein